MLFVDQVRKRLKRRRRERERSRSLQYLRAKDARVYKRIGDIALVQYPDHIAGRLLEGIPWGLRDFQDALGFLSAHLKGDVFIDFGANSGMHSIYAAREKLFGKIVAIEPLQQNYELLCVNLHLNRIENAIALRYAVSNREGELSLPTTQERFGASGMGDKSSEFEIVQARRLDNVLDELGIEPASVGLIWIAVRGHEKEVLEGMPRVLAAKVPLVINFHPFGEHDGAIRILQSHFHHCAWEGSDQPHSIASLASDILNEEHKWVAVW